MLKFPLISVIIPCYNAARFLDATLESVFAQTFKNFEVIVIDDGSTDETATLIRSFGSKLRAEFTPNQGASAARNLGTALAQGQFFQYLDADDLLRPDALEKRVNALIAHDADVAYSDWQRLEEGEDGKFHLGAIVARRIEEVHPDPQIALFTNFWAPPAALLYNHRIVNKIGTWNKSLLFIQDARFCLDAALMGGKFIHVPGVQADYRVLASRTSLSKRDPTGFMNDCFINACQVEEIWTVHGGITSERRIALEKIYGHIARFYFERNRLKFSEVLAKIHRLNPNYIPSNPKALHQLSQWVGYEQAEAISLTYRRTKKQLHRLVQKFSF
ncbi:glycosyl transferase family 2 [Scytonema hofmannii PCC 7110]|uniref:Glycosyl transferase family 2 n=1 Tax=Scytonema hofmannii PCC 7110 TaxID=128403 RepID=A0A139WWP5_9CYAN|nr:glycosyltransferase [Scytonema hofmannii]KYC36861.1 glycosyl transferase family 2 [Scytonema hofmannii PCC 7110]